MTARRKRRRGAATTGSRSAPDAGWMSEQERESAVTERARRYLDRWERNLMHLAIHGPAVRGKHRS